MRTSWHRTKTHNQERELCFTINLIKQILLIVLTEVVMKSQI